MIDSYLGSCLFAGFTILKKKSKIIDAAINQQFFYKNEMFYMGTYYKIVDSESL